MSKDRHDISGRYALSSAKTIALFGATSIFLSNCIFVINAGGQIDDDSIFIMIAWIGVIIGFSATIIGAILMLIRGDFLRMISNKTKQ